MIERLAGWILVIEAFIGYTMPAIIGVEHLLEVKAGKPIDGEFAAKAVICCFVVCALLFLSVLLLLWATAKPRLQRGSPDETISLADR